MSTCSELARSLGEPLLGTAPFATTWLALEQPGPWGRQALTQSHLDPALGRALERWADGSGVRLVLVRRPGRHADDHVGHPPRTVLISHVGPDRWLRSTAVADAAEVLAWDAAALGRGVPPGDATVLAGPVALVCTNGRRDLCCAVHGRALAQQLAADHPGRVWETSHLGGHRFAPTSLWLPTGVLHGHLTVDSARDVWAAAERDELVATGLRGRSGLSPQGQVAEQAVRGLLDAAGLDDLVTGAPEADGTARWTVAVAHRDGRRWRVEVRAATSRPARPESCGRTAVEPRRWVLAAVSRDR